MGELKSELSRSDMEKVLDLLSAPLAQKLRLAIDGWTNDNDYISRSLDRASPTELAAAAADTALVDKLVKTLSSNFLKSVLDRMRVPIARRIQYALSGWGKDEAYINQCIATSPIADVVVLANDAKTLATLDAEGLTGCKKLIELRLMAGGQPDEAFKLIVSPNDTILDKNLADLGTVAFQRQLLDGVITAGLDDVRVQRAFHAYWHVEVTSAPAVAATTSGGTNGTPTPAVAANNWPIPTLQTIHVQMKKLPDQDARAGVWNKLSLTNDPLLISRAAYGGGEFSVGSNASITDTQEAGYSVTLTTAANAAAAKIKVSEGPRFKVGDKLVLDRDNANKDPVTISAIAGNEYTLATPTTKAHGRGAVLDPDDGSGARTISWLEATVRHEIAHSLDGGGCDTTGFYAKGAWVLGEGDAGYDVWVTAMGGASAYTTNDGKPISDTDKAKIKAAIVDHVTNQKGSLFAAFAATPTHPIMKYQSKHVPVIVAAEACLRAGDNFYDSPTTLYAANGKRFTISWWYKRFQHHNEAVVSERVANYGLYAPTEFFAEAYTVFYEEAGRPGIKDEDYGRLIRNGDWRQWLRDNVHNRGHRAGRHRRGQGARRRAERLNTPGARRASRWREPRTRVQETRVCDRDAPGYPDPARAGVVRIGGRQEGTDRDRVQAQHRVSRLRREGPRRERERHRRWRDRRRDRGRHARQHRRRVGLHRVAQVRPQPRGARLGHGRRHGGVAGAEPRRPVQGGRHVGEGRRPRRARRQARRRDHVVVRDGLRRRQQRAQEDATGHADPRPRRRQARVLHELSPGRSGRRGRRTADLRRDRRRAHRRPQGHADQDR